MTTEVVAVDPLHIDREAIDRAAEILARGGLVAFPTETVYGLGADATNPAAVERIFQAKGRPATNPTIVHVADLAGAKACAAHWPSEADALADAFWPGALTIIVPAAPGVASAALAGGTTVGLRVPDHPIALALLKAVGKPIAAPSANRSETLSPTTAEHVRRTLDGRIDLILDGGPSTGGVESTVVDLSVSPPRLLRPGLIAVWRLRRLLEGLEIEATSAGVDASIRKSPGRFPRHYAPTTPMEIVPDLDSGIDERARLSLGVVEFVGRELRRRMDEGERVVCRWTLPKDAAQSARYLYSVLHDLDAMDLDRILVAEPPTGDDWSAIRDRLQRASTPASPES
jgi:L-threonylcarbamoyladenylate synthase